MNLLKSQLMGVRNVANLSELVATFGCQTEALPSPYLGLPLGEKYKSKTIWDPLIEKWKGVSMGSKITLVKCVLSSVPTYYPRSVVKRMEKLQGDVLWDGTNGESKIHLIRLERYLSPSRERRYRD